MRSGPGHGRLRGCSVRRLLDLGATETDWDSCPPEPDFVVLADPDGNLFCVVDLSRAPSGG